MKKAYTDGLYSITKYGYKVIEELRPNYKNRNNSNLISLWKSITMKIIQSFLIHKNFNGNMYTKKI